MAKCCKIRKIELKSPQSGNVFPLAIIQIYRKNCKLSAFYNISPPNFAISLIQFAYFPYVVLFTLADVTVRPWLLYLPRTEINFPVLIPHIFNFPHNKLIGRKLQAYQKFKNKEKSIFHEEMNSVDRKMDFCLTTSASTFSCLNHLSIVQTF